MKQQSVGSFMLFQLLTATAHNDQPKGKNKNYPLYGCLWKHHETQ